MIEPDLHARLGGGPGEQPDEVGAMELPVGPPVARYRRSTQRHPRHQPAVAVVAKLDRLRRGGERGGGLEQPERGQHRHAVRRDLDAGPDLAQRRRLLEHPHPRPAARQRQRRREAADAGADHRDLPPGQAHAAGGSPAQARPMSALTASRSTGRGFQ